MVRCWYIYIYIYIFLKLFHTHSTRWRTDLWELDDNRRAEVVTDRLESNFYARCPPERRPVPLRHLDNEKDTAGAIDAGNAPADDNDEKDLKALEAGAASPDPENENENTSNIKGKEKPHYDSSLPLAIQRTFFFPFWLSGILYATGGTSTLFRKSLTSTRGWNLTKICAHRCASDDFSTYDQGSSPVFGRCVCTPH